MLNVLSFNEKIIYIGDIMKKLTLLIALSVLLYSATASAMPPKSTTKAGTDVQAAAGKDANTQTDEMTPAAAEELAPLLEERDAAREAYVGAGNEFDKVEGELQKIIKAIKAIKEEKPDAEQAALTTQYVIQATNPELQAALEETQRTNKALTAVEKAVEEVRVKHGLATPDDE